MIGERQRKKKWFFSGCNVRNDHCGESSGGAWKMLPTRVSTKWVEKTGWNGGIVIYPRGGKRTQRRPSGGNWIPLAVSKRGSPPRDYASESSIYRAKVWIVCGPTPSYGVRESTVLVEGPGDARDICQRDERWVVWTVQPPPSHPPPLGFPSVLPSSDQRVTYVYPFEMLSCVRLQDINGITDRKINTMTQRWVKLLQILWFALPEMFQQSICTSYKNLDVVEDQLEEQMAWRSK